MSRLLKNNKVFELPIDDKVYQTIFKLYWEKVFSICRHYTASDDDARDLTQSIFLDLWKNRQNLEEGSNMEHYLSRAARFQSLAYLRDKATQNKHIQILKPAAEPQADNNPHSILEVSDTKARLNEIISELPEPSKTVFILNRFEHLSYREIAAKRNISERTVQYHISKSLEILRDKLVETV